MKDKKIRNIAIIAHVDHGKTTLIDATLKGSGIFRQNQRVEERIMDSNELEKERGITIFSKNASFFYEDYKINFVDTPGHADFGGEVQRVLKMVDSVLLLVDAVEGPMPQTKYVLKNSLDLGLKPIVLINKIDRVNARPNDVLNMVFDLFIDLNASEEQLDFPVLYTSAKDGIAKYNINDTNTDLIPLFETIVKKISSPKGENNKPFQLLISAIEYDNYIGKIATGRIYNGKVREDDNVLLIKRDGTQIVFRISKIFTYSGLKKISIPIAEAGEIVSIAGTDEFDIGETISDKEYARPLPIINIDEPTISMTFTGNDSPFMGNEGRFVTSQHLWERLMKEIKTNVSLIIEKQREDSFIVKARGELQLSILIENLRRDGYEFQVSKPEVIFKYLNGKKLEPIEQVYIDVDDAFAGIVIEKLSMRKGELTNMLKSSDGYTRLEFNIPSRGLIGYAGEFMTDTRGTGILNHSFNQYEYYKGDIPSRTRGALIALETGTSVAYALYNLQSRGVLFIGSGEKVYEGMVVGEHSKDNDLVINVCKTKKLTNIRAAGSDDAIKLSPPKKFSIEQALEFIDDDELLEITPNSLRIRKKILSALQRKRASRLAS